MKELIKEAKRMQQLAGIINESQLVQNEGDGDVSQNLIGQPVSSLFDPSNPNKDEFNNVTIEKILKQEGDVMLIKTDIGNYIVSTGTEVFDNLDLNTAAQYYFKLTKGVRN